MRRASEISRLKLRTGCADGVGYQVGCFQQASGSGEPKKTLNRPDSRTEQTDFRSHGILTHGVSERTIIVNEITSRLDAAIFARELSADVQFTVEECSSDCYAVAYAPQPRANLPSQTSVRTACPRPSGRRLLIDKLQRTI